MRKWNGKTDYVKWAGIGVGIYFAAVVLSYGIAKIAVHFVGG